MNIQITGLVFLALSRTQNVWRCATESLPGSEGVRQSRCPGLKVCGRVAARAWRCEAESLPGPEGVRQSRCPGMKVWGRVAARAWRCAAESLPGSEGVRQSRCSGLKVCGRVAARVCTLHFSQYNWNSIMDGGDLCRNEQKLPKKLKLRFYLGPSNEVMIANELRCN